MQERITLDGVVDVHSHCGPSPFARRVDAYENAKEAGEAGMDAVVFKEHFLPTVQGVTFVQRLLDRDGLDVLPVGSLVMNYCNGGFNPFMVQAAIDYGARVVWAPTIDARNHGERTDGVGKYAALIGGGEDEIGPEYEGLTGLYALDEDGELKRDVRLCLDKIAENDVAFFVGHLSYDETHAMIAYLADLGHEKMVVDHPNYFITDFDRDQQRELASLGAYMNLPFSALSPKFNWISAADYADNIRDLGVEHCLVSSDVGQHGNPSTPESLRLVGEILLDEGFSEAEFRTLAETTPKAVLGL